MEKEQVDRVEAWGREYLSAGGERSVHSGNPFLSRSHNLGILLKCLCLRDPSVMVPHSGDPSVREEAFNVRVTLGSLSVSWPLCRVQQQGPCLESHPASKGQEVVCLQSLFVWGPGSPPACSSQESSRGLANAQPWSRLALSDRPSLRWSFPACLPAGPVLSPGSCRPSRPCLPAPGVLVGPCRQPAPGTQEGLGPGTHSPRGQAGGKGHANSSSVFCLPPPHPNLTPPGTAVGSPQATS